MGDQTGERSHRFFQTADYFTPQQSPIVLLTRSKSIHSLTSPSFPEGKRFRRGIQERKKKVIDHVKWSYLLCEFKESQRISKEKNTNQRKKQKSRMHKLEN